MKKLLFLILSITMISQKHYTSDDHSAMHQRKPFSTTPTSKSISIIQSSAHNEDGTISPSSIIYKNDTEHFIHQMRSRSNSRAEYVDNYKETGKPELPYKFIELIVGCLFTCSDCIADWMKEKK